MAWLRGIVRFYLRGIEPFLDLYMTPVNIDPANPSLPISHPKTFSVYLAKRFGPYATQPDPANFNLPAPELRTCSA